MLQRLRSAAVRGCQRQVSRGFKSSTTLRDFQKTKKFPEVIGQQAASGGNFGSFVYQNLMKRNPTYAFVILGAAVAADYGYDVVMDGLWRSMNRGKLFDEVIPEHFPYYAPDTEPDDEEEEEDEE